MLTGWRAVPRRHVGEFPRRGALALGCVAVMTIGVVGCTKIADGSGVADTNVAPAYRSSVSASVSASSVTSSVRESQRQQSVTTSMIRTSCGTLGNAVSDTIDKVNAYVAALNAGKNTGPTEGPAIDALNNGANTVTSSINNALSPEQRDAFKAYSDAARAVANAISTHVGPSEFNRRVDAFNKAKSRAVDSCKGFI
ncbi:MULTISPECIES: hypothetical protein [Mycobacterium]|nr:MULTISPECIES: hypothetical protein [Mycobacterium]